MALGTNHQTIATHTIFIPELWDSRSQRERERALHLANFVYRRDDEVDAYGDVLTTQTISNLTANDKAASTQVTLQTPTEANVSLTIDKHKEASFLIEDNLAAKSMLNLQREYVGKGAYGVGRQVDTDLFGLSASLTQTPVGTAGVALTDAVVLAAWEALTVSDVPQEERCWFFYPDCMTDLWQLEKFIRTDFVTGETLNNNINGLTVGYLYGAPVKLTTNIPSTSTGSPATISHGNLYLHREAFQLGMQKKIRTQIDYILEYLAYLTVIDAIYGVAVYRADHGVVINR